MLLEFWQNYEPYDFHPEDKEYFQKENLRSHIVNASIDQVVEEFGSNLRSIEVNQSFKTKIENEKRIIRRLMPSPFVGDIMNAKIYILSGNPGFHTGDFIDEYQNPEYRKLVADNLSGKLLEFFYADEKAEGTGAHNYWHPQIAAIAKDVAEKANYPLDIAMTLTLSKIALIESFPYHSYRKPEIKFVDVPSSIAAKSFVNSICKQRLNNNECLILAWRMVDFWNVPAHKNLISRPKHLANRKILPDEIGKISDFIIGHL